MAASDLTACRLREIVNYDRESGVFVYRASGRGRVLGRRAGHAHCKGYREITVDGAFYLEHRLAWLYMTGVWPMDQIDHKDGDRSNNRWLNLRQATQSRNSQNLRAGHRDGSSGVLGVSYRDSKTRPWVAQIVVPIKRRIWLGSFPTKESAHAAYLAAKRLLHEGGTL